MVNRTVLIVSMLPVLRLLKIGRSSVLDNSKAPDYLINNAAVINQPGVLWEVPAGQFQQLMMTNVCGVHHLLRSFIPAMSARGSGVVVNFSSGWGRSAAPKVGPYCASKFAIEGLTSALAQELPAGMAAVAVNPGVIDTEMLQSCWGGATSQFPHPSRWAKKAVPFILSLNASHNGASLSVP
jgi:NAD(P)-dependent dehydrogenase (short-subunit alcohol dehydrogenase family)